MFASLERLRPGKQRNKRLHAPLFGEKSHHKIRVIGFSPLGTEANIAPIMQPPANDEPENLPAQLQELRIEHRDLDAAIGRLEAAPPFDELLLKRLKKRKLQLKDRISVIERLIEPDELA
jgi:hypothetical protein